MNESHSIDFPNTAFGSAEPMQDPEIAWLPGSQQDTLACRVWTGRPRLPVILHLHGIEGHSQWFTRTASALNQKGVTVYASDRRGSGLNSRQRGHLANHKVYLADIQTLIAKIAQDHSDSPLILMANCWSAKAAAIVAAQNDLALGKPGKKALSGLIFTCPAIYTKVDYPFMTRLKIAWSYLSDKDRSSRYWFLPLLASMYTNDPRYLSFLQMDPLRLQEVTTSFLVETMFLTWRAQRAAKSISLPVLLVQAGDDQIVDLDQIKTWYAEIASSDKTMRIFPGAYHSIDFDKDWFSEYTHLLLDWLSERSVVYS